MSSWWPGGAAGSIPNCKWSQHVEKNMTKMSICKNKWICTLIRLKTWTEFWHKLHFDQQYPFSAASWNLALFNLRRSKSSLNGTKTINTRSPGGYLNTDHNTSQSRLIWKIPGMIHIMALLFTKAIPEYSKAFYIYTPQTQTNQHATRWWWCSGCKSWTYHFVAIAPLQ